MPPPVHAAFVRPDAVRTRTADTRVKTVGGRLSPPQIPRRRFCCPNHHPHPRQPRRRQPREDRADQQRDEYERTGPGLPLPVRKGTLHL
jgi:hypothetical protein